MTDSTDTDAQATFETFAQLCEAIYGTKWRSKFAADFGVANQTLTAWGTKGPPTWAVRAAYYAHRAQLADKAVAAFSALARGSGD